MPTPAMAAMITPTKPNTVSSLAWVFKFSNHLKKFVLNMGTSSFSLAIRSSLESHTLS
jgi:hypothetical protein